MFVKGSVCEYLIELMTMFLLIQPAFLQSLIYMIKKKIAHFAHFCLIVHITMIKNCTSCFSCVFYMHKYIIFKEKSLQY